MPTQLRGYRPGGGVTHIGPTAEELRRRLDTGQVSGRDITALSAAASALPGGGGLAGATERGYAMAQQANERRYQEILGGYREREALGEDMFAPVYGDIERRGGLRGESMRQGLAQRGLAGSSLEQTMQAGIDREMAAEQARAALMEAEYRNRLMGDRLAFMERREDVPPDIGRAAELERQAGFHGLDDAGQPPSFQDMFGPQGRTQPQRAAPAVPAGRSLPSAGGASVGGRVQAARTQADRPESRASITYYGPEGARTAGTPDAVLEHTRNRYFEAWDRWDELRAKRDRGENLTPAERGRLQRLADEMERIREELDRL